MGRMLKTMRRLINKRKWQLVLSLFLLWLITSLNPVSIPIAAIIALVFSMGAINAEERFGADHLYLSLPISRLTVVRGRFAFTLTVLCATVVLNGVIICLAPSHNLILLAQDNLFYKGIPYMALSRVAVFLACKDFAVCGLLCLCVYPLAFRIGFAKGRLIGGAAAALLAYPHSGIVGKVLQRLYVRGEYVGAFSHGGRIGRSLPLTCAILFAVGAALFALSYALSVRAYAKRDL